MSESSVFVILKEEKVRKCSSWNIKFLYRSRFSTKRIQKVISRKLGNYGFLKNRF